MPRHRLILPLRLTLPSLQLLHSHIPLLLPQTPFLLNAIVAPGHLTQLRPITPRRRIAHENSRKIRLHKPRQRWHTTGDNPHRRLQIRVQCRLGILIADVLRDGGGVDPRETHDGDDADDAAEPEDAHEDVALAGGELEGAEDGEGEEGYGDVGEHGEGGVEEPVRSAISSGSVGLCV